MKIVLLIITMPLLTARCLCDVAAAIELLDKGARFVQYHYTPMASTSHYDIRNIDANMTYDCVICVQAASLLHSKLGRLTMDVIATANSLEEHASEAMEGDYRIAIKIMDYEKKNMMAELYIDSRAPRGILDKKPVRLGKKSWEAFWRALAGIYRKIDDHVLDSLPAFDGKTDDTIVKIKDGVNLSNHPDFGYYEYDYMREDGMKHPHLIPVPDRLQNPADYLYGFIIGFQRAFNYYLIEGAAVSADTGSKKRLLRPVDRKSLEKILKIDPTGSDLTAAKARIKGDLDGCIQGSQMVSDYLDILSISSGIDSRLETNKQRIGEK